MGQLSPRALIVDDERQIRWIVATVLSKEGFTCDVAEGGSDALRFLATQKYDVVVTDLSMPQGDGCALAVKLLKESPRPLIVVHTGVLEPALAKELIDLGVDDIVFKPVHLPTFAAKIKALLERRQHLVTRP